MHTQQDYFNQQPRLLAPNYQGGLAVPYNYYNQIQSPDISLGMLRPEAIQNISPGTINQQLGPRPKQQSLNAPNKMPSYPAPFSPLDNTPPISIRVPTLSLKHKRLTDLGSCKVIKLEHREERQNTPNQKLPSLDHLTNDTSNPQPDISLSDRYLSFNTFQSNNKGSSEFEMDQPLSRIESTQRSDPNLQSYGQLLRCNEGPEINFKSALMSSKPSPQKSMQARFF